MLEGKIDATIGESDKYFNSQIGGAKSLDLGEPKNFGVPAPDSRHALHLNTNRSKRSVAIDLKHPAGQKLATELALARMSSLRTSAPG